MNTLFIFQFETGDTDCVYWEIPVFIKHKCTVKEYRAIESRFRSFVEELEDDYEYKEIVESVMNEFGFEWKFVNEQSACPELYIVRAS